MISMQGILKLNKIVSVHLFIQFFFSVIFIYFHFLTYRGWFSLGHKHKHISK